MEALALEHTFVRALLARWQQIGYHALISFGVGEADAEEESRLVIDTFYGVQFDLVVNGDETKATATFSRAVALHRRRIEQLLGQSVEPPAGGPLPRCQNRHMATSVNPPRGMRDFLPVEKARRERALDVIRETYRRTASTRSRRRSWRTRSRLHAGLGGDNEKLAFAMMKRGLDAETSRRRRRAARPRRPRPALRPHRPARPVLRHPPRRAAAGVPRDPDRAGVARRASAEGPFPPVHAVRHRHHRRGRHPGRDRAASWRPSATVDALGLTDATIRINDRQDPAPPAGTGGVSVPSSVIGR